MGQRHQLATHIWDHKKCSKLIHPSDHYLFLLVYVGSNDTSGCNERGLRDSTRNPQDPGWAEQAHNKMKNSPTEQKAAGQQQCTVSPLQFKIQLSINLGSTRLMMSSPGAPTGDLKDILSAGEKEREPAFLLVTAEAAAGAGHQDREVSELQGSIYMEQYRLHASEAKE